MCQIGRANCVVLVAGTCNREGAFKNARTRIAWQPLLFSHTNLNESYMCAAGVCSIRVFHLPGGALISVIIVLS